MRQSYQSGHGRVGMGAAGAESIVRRPDCSFCDLTRPIRLVRPITQKHELMQTPCFKKLHGNVTIRFGRIDGQTTFDRSDDHKTAAVASPVLAKISANPRTLAEVNAC